ncbi:MAG: hypothetical protein AB7V18_19080 [Pyrinomonadaceae bacterium]
MSGSRIPLVPFEPPLAVDLLPHLEGNKDWSPDAWSPRHRLVIALHLGGDRNWEIAEKLNLSENYVSVILNDPRAVYEIERMSERVADRTVDTSLRLKLYANEALDEIVEELRTSKSEKIRQIAAFGILDRAGYTPAKHDAAQAAPTLPAEVVQRMETTTQELVSHSIEYKQGTMKEKPAEPKVEMFEPKAGEQRSGTEDGK